MSEHTSIVNEALRLPLADAFARDMDEILATVENDGMVVLALIDLDHFMAINNTYGHDTGDRVLIETGEYLRSRLPDGAALYRYGGDEFAVVFAANWEKEDVLLHMESLRREYPVKLPNGTAPTISIGIAAAFEDAETTSELVRKTESAMFRGKTMGRNRVCLAREEKMVTKTAHYTVDQLARLTKVSKREGIGEAILLREALDALLKKYDG